MSGIGKNPEDELARCQERARKLAMEKSYLQLVNNLMLRLGEVTGVEAVVENILRLLLDNLGGSNLSLYYFIGTDLNFADVYGKKSRLEKVADELVLAAMNSREFQEIENDFGRTGMLTPEFTKASTWAAPLIAGDELVGVLKLEDMLMGAAEIRNQLEPFLRYSALVLKNEISGYATLKKAFDDLSEANARLSAEMMQRETVEKSLRITQFAVDHAADSLFWITRDACFANVNAAACTRLGYSREELLQMTVFDVDPFFPRAGWEAHWQEIKERKSFTIETSHRTKGGEIFPVEVSANYVEYEGGEYNFAFARDISDRKQANEALRRAKDDAEAANRAKSVFIANMSHELRTPLSAILGFSDILRRDEGITAAQRETLAIIHRSGDHLLGLINDVLEIAKIEAGRIVLENDPFDLGSMILDVTGMLRLRAEEKGVQLFLDQSSRFPRYITGDEAKLRQIVTNLLSNAIKATEQGVVTLRLRVKHNHCDHLLIEVEDTGCGIAAEDQARIFKAFVQVGSPGRQQGTGLGLTISRQFVELMGGELSLTSTPGKGSTFRVDLPVQLARPEEIPLAPPVRGEVTGLAPDQPAFKVLVVEDQPESQLLLVRLLGSVGFDVKLAENGALGVEQFIAWQPDFIWMDRRMPVMDGKEATVRIRALPGGDRVKIAAVTASAFLENDAELMSAGFDAIVHKPFRSEELFDCMEELLGLRFVRSAVEQEPPPLRSKLTAEALAALPDELRQELESALRSLDMALIEAVIGRVAELNPPLAAQLKLEADRLAYSEILTALGGGSKVKIP